ncbi:MAG: glycosyltransferase family 2 protein [Chitinophagales bacterium]
MQKPFISIILCTYNDGLFLEEAIQSMLNQTFADFEFIIINDGSTDNTKSIIHNFASPKIRYFEHPENRGQEDSKNLGLSKATGKYVAYMDGDDISEPDRLQIQFDFMEQHPEIGICSTCVHFFGYKTGIFWGTEKHNEIQLNSLFSTSMTHATCMIRRSVLEYHKIRYKKGYLAAEDFLFLSEVITKTKTYCIQKPLYHYRQHGMNISNQKYAVQVNNFSRISRHNFKTWLGMDDLTENEHKTICAFFRGDVYLETLPIVDSLIKEKLNLAKTGAFGQTFLEYYGKRLLEVYVSEGGKGLKNLAAFLRNDVWRYLPFRRYFLTYALIISRSIYRSVIPEPVLVNP